MGEPQAVRRFIGSSLSAFFSVAIRCWPMSTRSIDGAPPGTY
jgi:hypothetical protein